MFLRIKVWTASKGWFWRIRSQFSKHAFRFEKLGLSSKAGIQTQIQKTNIGWQLLWIGSKKFLLVVIVLFGLEFLERYIGLAFQLSPWPTEIQQDDYNSQLEFYSVLLAAIFSIYFATIGIILSTGYAKLNRDIIALLIGEQVGNIYTGILIFATTFCLTVTAINVFGHQTGFLIYLLASVLTILSVLTLFPIGQRLFGFFELAPLIDGEILPKITQNIENVTKSGSSISFQNHFSLQAQNRLKQLFYIDDRLQMEMIKLAQNLPLLTKRYSGLLIHYLHQKHKIPKESYWYPRKRIHPDWFLAGDSATRMALNTGSQIPPEEKPDLDWFEDELLNRIHSHFEKALKTKKWELALELLSDLSPRVLRYANGMYFSIGVKDIETAREMLEKYLPDVTTDDAETLQHVIALADTWAALAHNFHLETLRRIQTFDTELKSFFDKDDWTFQASKKLPSFLQIEIRHLQDYVEFEEKIEGKRLSQPKYLQQLTMKPLLENYSNVVQSIAKFEKNEFVSFSEKLIEIGHPAAATQVILTALHSNWKLPMWFADLDKLFRKYLEYENYEDKYYLLPRIDLEQFQNDFEKQRQQLITMLTDEELGSHLFDLQAHNSSLPDHFGQTYFLLANECFYALDQNDEQTLQKVFETFFSLAFMAANVKFVNPKLNINQEYRLRLISSANKDIATLLGYAILYSEHHENQNLQKIPLSIWDNMLEQSKDKKRYLEQVLKFSASHSFSMYLSPRDIIRTDWKMKFETRLREAGFEERYSSFDQNQHPSDIVEEFRGAYYDASDVFFALHVLDEIDLKDDKINRQITDYKFQLARRQEGEK